MRGTGTSTEIVISYAGTGPGWSDWIHGNTPLALGQLSDQLKQAADYYLLVREQKQSATISFTGHSLGGGLASLMAVMFGESATTFDQAPFRKSALTYTTDANGNPVTHSVAQELLAYLSGETANGQPLYTDFQLQGLRNFINASVADSGVVPNAASVTNINVNGEVLGYLPLVSRIGTTVMDISNGSAGASSIDLHSQALLTAMLQSGDTQNTTAANHTLGQVSIRLPDLLKMVFDKNLFYNEPNNTDTNALQNFLEHIVRHQTGGVDGVQAGGDDMVNRFTADLWKLAQDGGLTMNDWGLIGGNNNVSKALTAFAMQFYYEDTANAADRTKQLFTDLAVANEGSNGIRFDMHDVSRDIAAAMDSTDPNVKVDLAAKDASGKYILKGFEYFQSYLNQVAPDLGAGASQFTPAEKQLILSILPTLRDWYVQAGANGMLATDTMNRGAFMLGGNGNDALVGGTGADLLVGNAGTDLLQGGQGNDTLLGGAGNDAYVYTTGDGLDTILDTGGQNTLAMDGNILAGGDQYGDNRVHKDANGHLYVQAGNNLIIDGNIVIQNYGSGGTFGLNLSATPVADPAPSNTIVGDLQPILDANNNLQYDPATGNVITDQNTPAPGYQDRLYGDAGDDVIEGRGGIDILSGGAGNDILYGGDRVAVAQAIANGDNDPNTNTQGDWFNGGSGSDTLVGGAGDDILMGGGGQDLIVAGAGDDHIMGDGDYSPQGTDWSVAQTGPISANILGVVDPDAGTVPDGASDVIYAGNGNDFVVGGLGNDILFGGEGNDTLWGDDANIPQGNDYLEGGRGDDNLIGGGGNDIYAYNLGDGSDKIYDRIVAGETNRLLFGAGIALDDLKLSAGDNGYVLTLKDGSTIQLMSGASGYVNGHGSLTFDPQHTDIQQLQFADGGGISWADFLKRGLAQSGSDATVLGSEYDDELTGVNSTLVGGAGSDTYSYKVGDGKIHIKDFNIGGDTNTLKFGPGITAAQIKLGLGSLRLDLGNGEEVHIDNFNPDDALNSSTIRRFEFADGAVLGVAELLARGFDLAGTAGDDTITGTSVDDRINGYAGDDTLSGGAGDDVLDGGAGNDILQGGAGNDTYLFDPGDGQDTVVDGANAVGNVVRFGEGVAAGNTRFFQQGADLLVKYGTQGDTILIQNFAPNGFANAHAISEFQFADGSQGVYMADGQGNAGLKAYDANGRLAGEFWQAQDGGYGNDTYNADGSSSGSRYSLDGSYSNYTNDGVGNVQMLDYNDQGINTGGNWSKADGSHGSDVFNSDGSSNGTIHLGDGSYRIYTNDGYGNSSTFDYDASGIKTGEEWIFANGNYRIVSVDADGNVVSTVYNDQDVKLSGSWSKADGSFGSDNFNSDGSSSGVIHRADGTYNTYTNDGQGQVVTKNYSWNGSLTGSNTTETNGLHNVITSYSNAAGVKLSETWIHSDGSSGSNLVSALDYNGTQNLKNQVVSTYPNYGTGTYSYGSWVNPDGARGSFFGGDSWGNGSFKYENDYKFAALPGATWGGSGGDYVYLNSDGSPSVIGSETYFSNGYIRYEARPVSVITGGRYITGIAQFDFSNERVGVDVNGILETSGAKYLVAAGMDSNGVWHSSRYSLPTVQTSITVTVQGINGGYSIFRDDGLGNMELVSYDASGVKLDEMWLHNDGSHGYDNFNADGSIAGQSINPDGTTVSYYDDGHGNVVTTTNRGILATLQGVSFQMAPLPDIGLLLPPASLDAPPGYGYSMPPFFFTTGPDNQGGTYTYQWMADGTVNVTHLDANGNVLSGGFVQTDPGFGANTVVDGRKTGWIYDVAGVPTSSYCEDGAGNLVTYFYDEQGRIASSSLAATDSQGGVATVFYDAAGSQTGSSIKLVTGQGRETTTTYDASGQVTGSSIVVTDGQSNTVTSSYDASGALLSFSTMTVASTGEVNISSYDAQGMPTGVITTTTSSEGVITTSTFDGAGKYTGTITANTFSAGNFETSDYDATGALLFYVMLTSNDQHDTIVTTYDAYGIKIRDNTLKADGSQVSNSYQHDGSIISTAHNLDRSFSISNNDAMGNVTTTYYNAQEVKLSEAWVRADGSNGTNIFNPDGTLSGTASYADGTSSTSINNGQGQVVTSHYGTDGIAPTGTTVYSNIDGVMQTISYGANGVKLSDNWIKVNGTSGNHVFNEDGSGSGVVIDINGTTTTTNYGANGIRLNDSWEKIDGSYGNGVFNADGSSSGTSHNSDGGYSHYTNSGYGDTTTTNYDSSGSKLSEYWAKSDGTSGYIVFNADNSYSSFFDDGYGNTTTTNYGVDGFVLEESWNKLDGSWGRDTYSPDGSSNGEVHNADGGYSVYSRDWQGNITSSETHNADGSYSTYVNLWNGYQLTTTNYDANGNKLSDSWSLNWGGGAGGVGSNIFNADGSSESTATYTWQDGSTSFEHTIAQLDGSYQTAWDSSEGWGGGEAYSAVDNLGSGMSYHADGSYSNYTFSGNWSDCSWLDYSADGIKTGGGWYTADGSNGWDAFNADGSSNGETHNADGSYSRYANNGLGEITTHNYDTNANLIGYSIVADDGMGNVHTSNYDAGGVLLSDSWVHTNSAPQADVIADQAAIQDTAFSFHIPGESFSDPDVNDALTYSATLSDGTALPTWLSFDAATQTFSGTPSNGDVGILNVLVTATDTGGLSASSAFNLNVVNVNDAPTANADTGAATEDGGAVLLDVATLLANDTDPDFIHGDALNIVGVSQATSGAVVSLVNGGVQYDVGSLFQSLGQGQTATDTFSYTVSDLAGATSTATVTMTVSGVNDGPVTMNDATTVQEDTALVASGNVLSNDSDVDQGTVLSVANACTLQGNYGSLMLNADGSYTYALDNASPGVQSLAAGQVVTETFAYEATDGTVATPSALTVSITGTNDAPVAAADAAYVREDLNITATGNALTNDSDVDQGTLLTVADAGTRQGSYGQLALATDGSYSYTLDNASMSVQSLGRDAQAVEHFGYTATDGMVGASAVLDIFLNGTNDAPILVAPLADQNFTFHKHFSWQMPEGSFTDIDQGDTLTYGAALADGSALPDWLKFDAATRTFSGETPKEVGFVDVQVTATDSVAATGSTVGSLSASDVFRISVSHGNEGVGNGEDAPPAGHDHNTNDGAGTSPGYPGNRKQAADSGSHSRGEEPDGRSSKKKSGKDDAHAEDDGGDDSRNTDDLVRSWFEKESASEQFSSFSLMGRNSGWGGQIDRQVHRNVARGISGDVSQEWARMNARLKKHLEQSGGDEGLFAESGAGSRSFGLFGSGGQQGIAQLDMGNGSQMKGFAGLREGLERLGG